MSELVEEGGFDTWRKRIGFVLAPMLGLITYAMVSGVSEQGRVLSGILVAVATLWVSETLPLPVTALLGALLCIILGVAPAKEVLSYFADPTIFLFIGSFMLARAMMVHGLDRRIALSFLSIDWIQRSPARILCGLGLVTAVISMWVSNTATTAMMLPIGLGILGALHQVRVASGEVTGEMDARHWPYATGMMLMIAYGASIGGIGTPVGSPPNLIGINLIAKAPGGMQIDFFKWMMLCVPLLIVSGAALAGLLYWMHPAPARSAAMGSMKEYLDQEKAGLGGWSAGQINTMIAFAVAIILWILPGILALPIWGESESIKSAADWMKNRLPEAAVAMVSAILLFILPTSFRKGEFTLNWSQASRIDWGTILLFGGGLALGDQMFKTGVAEALGKSLTNQLGVESLWMLTGLSIAMGIILSEASSNTASANMIIPVVIGICDSAGLSPVPPALGACLGASFGFMLPVSTPPNAIVYGSGLVPIRSMMRAGIVFDILGFFIIWAGLRILCPVLGLM